MPLKSKNGQICICVDFPNLNKACSKDDFSSPIFEFMVDAVTEHEALSFMDGSFGYNQIRISPKDKECTTFHTPKGIYCYKVKCYVDDLVVKIKKREYLSDLQVVFDRLRKYNLKMNPLKCALDVLSGKLLGFIVRQHVLGAPTPEKPLILYRAAQEQFLRALMEQQDEEGKEKTVLPE
ncbi:UNVERIFIED_CONTAM: hypothetical protein Sindi_1460000 [Sesamum indicum]